MKKVVLISDKIKNNSFSYTGKAGFEVIVNKYKEDILTWLEELIPLQKQMDMLYEKENIEFQKRNYTRILTKFFSAEYKEFVSVNILLRDASFIKSGFEKQNDIISLYSILVTNNYLKYPGRSEKYVEFDIFEEFVKVYKDELDIDYIAEYKEKEEAILLNVQEKEKEKTKLLKEKEKKSLNDVEKINEDIVDEPVEEIKEIKKDNEENYWTNLLLGKK